MKRELFSPPVSNSTINTLIVCGTNLFIQWTQTSTVAILLKGALPRSRVHIRNLIVRAIARKIRVRDCVDFRTVPVAVNFLCCSSSTGLGVASSCTEQDEERYD